MGTLHQIITKHGATTARSMADTKTDMLAVDAAAAVMSDEDGRLAITHAGFAMTNLPHKPITEDVWMRKGQNTTLLIESGRDSNGKQIGVPYGSMARLILLYLQTEAIRTGGPEVALGRSMKNWMERMGLERGGSTYRRLAEQSLKISSCRLTFFSDHGSAEVRENGAFVRGAISLIGLEDSKQPTLWQDKVRLDDGFWRSLRDHPVPVREEAIQAISSRSFAIDVYIWLAYRLHALSRPTPVTWAALHSQFGAGFKHVRQFKPRFLESLTLALAVYPEACVDVGEGGIKLHPSAPAIPRAEAKRMGIS